MSASEVVSLIAHNNKYTHGSFDKNGFYLSKLADLGCVGSLLMNIEELQIFADKTVSKAIFNENRDASESHGRNMVIFNKLFSKKKTHRRYEQITSGVMELSNQLMAACNESLGYTMKQSDTMPTILETVSSSTSPQLLHTDFGYDYTYTEQVLCLVALQDNTNIRVLRGSHAFASLEELDLKITDGSVKYMVPQVITLMKGEYIIMHPKMWHSGWTANEHNVRVHYCFNMSNIKRNARSAQNDTYFLDNTLQTLYNGVNYNDSVKNIRRKGIARSKVEKSNRLKRLGKWNKTVVG